MSPELALLEGGAAKRSHLRAVADTPLRVADVALFYGERSGGIRIYLDAKAEHAVRTGEIEHHVLAHRYASARCVVMPGEHETFGLAALEAAACGTPVAACSTAPALHAIGALGHGARRWW